MRTTQTADGTCRIIGARMEWEVVLGETASAVRPKVWYFEGRVGGGGRPMPPTRPEIAEREGIQVSTHQLAWDPADKAVGRSIRGC